MGRPLVVSAWARFDEDTNVHYVPCQDGVVELMIGGDTGINLVVTDAGLDRLADVIEAARTDQRRLALADDKEPRT
ncbi:MAG TPA: hypothetical protein VFW65_29625 [Pseudonocardiaceae bacterium]|nr:hypothetical protein [Pseudonocardiaceae bacterium]